MSTQLDRLRAALADRYAVEREIGAGGMATVYLAQDLKHDRQVAVKVLRPELAAALGPERFLREIRIAAQLQHPHILPLHDSGEADGFLYYVMPYVDGESLRERIDQHGELPVVEAVKIVQQVVDALAYAHEKGVVHRDIKPDNVMLSGRHALVMDFGVAKAVSEATGRQSLTTAGVALGTPAYMAPEQAMADPHVDHRADIYAVGALAYELLTGRPPFTGATPQAILAAHVTEPVEPVSKGREKVSPALESLVMRCLEKKPADRWQSAEEMLPHLEVLATPSGGMTPTATAPVTAVARKTLSTPGVIVAAMGLALVGAVATWILGGDSVPTTANNTQITREAGIEFWPRFSPNGAEVAYTGGSHGAFEVYVRNVGGGRAVSLTEDMAGNQGWAFWAADGNNLVFQSFESGDTVVTHQLMPKLGGAPRVIGRLSAEAIWDWEPGGDRVALTQGDTIFVRPAEGGDARVVAVADGPHSLRWSPDGSHLAYVSDNAFFVSANFLGNIAPSSIWIVDAEGGEPVPVTDALHLNQSPVWMPDGRHLLFVSDRDGPRDIYWVGVSGRGRPQGEPARLTSGLDAHTIDVSADGRNVAYSRYRLQRNIWSLPIPEEGPVSVSSARQITTENQIIEVMDLSPDGKWLVYDSNLEGNQDIFRRPREGGEPVRLTTNPADDFAPAWSPDGSEIAFHSVRTGNRDVFVIPAAGGKAVQLTDAPGWDLNAVWSPDGLKIAFWTDRSGLPAYYYISRDRVGGEWNEAKRLTPDNTGLSITSRWSPDGRFFAYSDASSIKLVPPGGDPRTILSFSRSGIRIAGTGVFAWSSDGLAVYVSATAHDGSYGIWSVPISGGDLTLLVKDDDPRTSIFVFRRHGNEFFLVRTEQESDIFTMDLLFE